MSAPRSGLVAVLFTDLVGSTELMSQLGDRAFDEFRRQHFAALSQAVAAHGGEEVKNTGDGLMAVFPSAAEAVEAAVAMQQAAARQARTSQIAIRVGLAVGDATLEGGDVFGTPVVEAARLVAAAEAGQILATAVVRTLAGSRSTASFADLAPLELKGLPAPVPACEVAWEQAPVSIVPLPAFLTDMGRVFVGRDGEMKGLEQLWKEAAAGERRVALLAGEPGVGKTRLAAELATAARDQGAVVLAGRCDEDMGVPYQPFVEALRHFVDHTAAEHLVDRLGRYGGELARLVPDLVQRAPDLPSPLRSDPETERYRLFDAVAGWLAAASFEEPILLLLDDLQWAAKPTLLLLRHVVRSSEPIRVLVLGTYRDSELAHDHPLVEVLADLRRQEGVERIPLSGFDQAAVVSFMAQAAGHEMDDDGLALAQAIHTETEGNPFFVREVIRHLTETGGIEQQDGRWVTTLSVEELGIPEGVREVVGRRLSRLSKATNRVLRVAAVVGPEFEVPVIQAVSGIHEEDLLSALEEATEARLVAEVLGPTARYRFAHALVRDTLYDGLSAARRVALHRQVAEAIETFHAGGLDDHLPALTHHWSKASVPAADTAKAVDYATRAGDRALAQLAHDEAAAYYRQALELLDAAPGTPDEGRRLDLLVALGDAQRRAGDPASRDTLLEAAALARAHGDADALARAALANTRGAYWSSGGTVDHERVTVLEAALAAVGEAPTAVRARLLATLGIELVFTPDRERRVRLSDAALQIGRSLGDAATLAHVLMTRAYAINTPDTLAERLAGTAELLTLAEGLGDPLVEFMAHFLRARFALETGEIEHEAPHLQRAQALAAELGQPTLRWMVGWVSVGHLLLTGRIEDADRAAHEAFQLGQSNGQPDANAIFTAQWWAVRFEQGRLGELESGLAEMCARYPAAPGIAALLSAVYCEVGRDDEARTCFERLAAISFDLPRDPLWLGCLTVAADVARHLDDRSSAGILYDLLQPYPTVFAVVVGVSRGCTAHYLGQLATTIGRHADAEEHFLAAAAAHDRVGAPCCLARTRLEWARMLLARRQPGDVERARQLLDQALATARELGLANVERRAVALLQDCR